MHIVQAHTPLPIAQEMFVPTILGSMLNHIEHAQIGEEIDAAAMAYDFKISCRMVASDEGKYMWNDEKLVIQKAEEAIHRYHLLYPRLLERIDGERYMRILEVK